MKTEHKSRLINLCKFVIICLIIDHLCTLVFIQITGKEILPGFIALCSAVGTIISALIARYGFRETALSKSSPSVVEKMITK